MDKSSADAYVYARASGMLAKSFVGERTSLLFEPKSVSELWSLIFNEEVPMVPENMLIQMLEKKAEKKFIDDFTMLIETYSKPSSLYLSLLRYYDFSNIKTIVTALRKKRSDIPPLVDIGRFSNLDLNAWPNLEKITKNTSFSWYKKLPDLKEEADNDTKLDLQYTQDLWKSVCSIPRSQRAVIQDFVKEELILTNVIWALRLRVYYEMPSDEILLHLAYAGKEFSRKDILIEPLILVLTYPLDMYEQWKEWKYFPLINEPQDGSNVWNLDPRWVQYNVEKYLNKKILTQFHKEPLTMNTLFSWFKIKQHELNCIRIAAEGLRLNVQDSQLKEFAGVKK